MIATDTKLHDEPARLAALRSYEILDTPREAAFDRITSLVRTVLNVPIAIVTLVDKDRQWFKSCIGLESDSTPRDISFCTHTIMSRNPMNVPNARLDPRFAENPLVLGPPHIGSYLGVPLCTHEGYNLGSLCVIDTQPRNFDKGQEEVLKSFAALVMDELELRRIAAVDYLTGAASRRTFCLETERCMARYSRHQRPSSLVVFDIDYFKKVNDTYGHPGGDAALRSICATLGMLLRSTDTMGRLGGEEFGILLADTGSSDAFETAERLRRAVEATTIPFDPPFNVTASFGVVPYRPEFRTADDWLCKADEALYESKRNGRNRVTSAPSDPF